MHRCHVRCPGVGSAEALLRFVHAREAALLPLLAPDGECEALDVAHVGGTFRVRVRIRTRGASVMWVQVEHQDLFVAVSECFDVARRRLERGRARHAAVVKASPERAGTVARSAV